jgi:cobalt-zinc-cadmium resistance protein CzcA
LLEKKKLLIGIDSIYSEFLNKANLRFQKGESNVLEKATAENQQGQIAIQLKQLQQDIEIAQLQFQFALNTSTLFIPSEENFKRRFSDITISDLEQSPRIQFLQQQKQIASANTQLQKSKLSPDLIFGYNNTSIRGTGADDKYYSASKRFHAVQVGVGIPLFNSAQKARINASKVNESIADNSYLLGLQTLQKEKETALIDYQKFLQTANWYEQTALKSVETISSTATKQFINGDINYLEWVMLTNQSVTIKSQYLDVIKSLNESINQLNYLNNK